MRLITRDKYILRVVIMKCKLNNDYSGILPMSLISRSTSTASIHMVTDSTIQTVDTCQGTVISICPFWTFYTTQITLHRNAINQWTSTTIKTQGIIVWCAIVITNHWVLLIMMCQYKWAMVSSLVIYIFNDNDNSYNDECY